MEGKRFDEKMKDKLISLATQIEMVRLEIYQNAVDSEEKQYLNDKLFELQSKLNYDYSETAYLLDYKNLWK